MVTQSELEEIVRSSNFTKDEKIKTHNITKQEIDTLRQKGNSYYEDYFQEYTLNKPGYGNIYFNDKNSGKNVPHILKIYPKLKNILKKAKIGKPTNNKKEVKKWKNICIMPRF